MFLKPVVVCISLIGTLAFAQNGLNSDAQAQKKEKEDCYDIKLNISSSLDWALCAVSEVTGATSLLVGSTAATTGGVTTSGVVAAKKDILRSARVGAASLLNPNLLDSEIRAILKDGNVVDALRIVNDEYPNISIDQAARMIVNTPL